MSDDPRKYEPHVDTSDFLDSNGEYTPDSSKSIKLPQDRQRIVDTVVSMYSGKIESVLKDFEACYAKNSLYDDIMSFSDTRCVISSA
jgi:hypothetical protein